ncbi:SDR family NAD(P)-dependent oxidoreductase [Streptomyces sp. NPDC088762]|uniref:SDR family NAD(P)-dependent oxidoreductase n=1 Tax=Streptomyces sp. NPDC088762 TaxID=3365891 RepID=UPI0037FDEC2C
MERQVNEQTSEAGWRASVLVTGATREIGLATALLLARQGRRVIEAARSQDKADALVRAARDQGLVLDAVVMDGRRSLPPARLHGVRTTRQASTRQAAQPPDPCWPPATRRWTWRALAMARATGCGPPADRWMREKRLAARSWMPTSASAGASPVVRPDRSSWARSQNGVATVPGSTRTTCTP